MFYFFVQKEKYESLISMYPSYGDDFNNSSLMSLVDDFGIGQGLNTTDPVIYVPDIVNSYILRKELLLKKYDSLENRTLLDYFESKRLIKIFNYEQSELIDEYSEDFDDLIKVDIGRTSGLITISTYFDTLDLSVEVRDFIYNYLINFINKSYKDSSEAKVKYINQRKIEVKDELEFRENQLKDFLVQNKDFDSPLLQIEYLRLSREVELTNTVYALLVQQVETEKLSLKKEELNFVVSDIYNNPKAVKMEFIEILMIDLLILMSIIVIFNRKKLKLNL
tara:strand:+ start:10268 stop:11104 length:837 start_codon:yes stop_codon:yes gene_type:complete